MINFSDTEIAFKNKTNKDLYKASFLFKLIERPNLVTVGKSLTRFAFNFHLPVKSVVKKTIYSQFCGGESIGDCADTIQSLSEYHIGTILDYSVEGKSNEQSFNDTYKELIRVANLAKDNSKIPFIVFKMTGIARFGLLEKMNNPKQELSPLEREEFQRVHHRVNNICKAAFDAKTPIFIDAEESWIQNSIDRISTAMMNVYNKEWACVYNTIQMYRHDRYQFLVDSLDDATKNNYLLGVKFVRGAYMEKERNRAIQMNYKSPIQPNKEASDMDYNKAIEFSIAHVDRISICNATHNEKSSLLLIELMEKHNIKKNDKRIYFAQLLGMSDNISYNLAYHGFNVAKYVPYGPVVDVLPYLFRRAEENTSVKGQTGRELSLIQTEIRRRRRP